jgi:hypothetical protein
MAINPSCGFAAGDTANMGYGYKILLSGTKKDSCP